ncbi:MAG: glycosyltransferase [Rhodospirillales bacterium]
MRQPKIAVLLPCYNEEVTIGAVVGDFREALGDCDIYVYDNNSTDRTAEEAAGAGAMVRAEPRQGKGNVVRRMFADIDADVYVMADGDGTYDAAKAPKMIDLLVGSNLDMVVGTRVEMDGGEGGPNGGPYRPGHRFGNWLFTRNVALLFGQRFTDILSGYRVFSRRFVKSFPAISSGFEIETELSVHCLDLGLPVGELQTPYKSRPEGSSSKLGSYRDGLRILGAIFMLFKENRPLLFFSLMSLLLAAVSVVLAAPLLVTYLETGLVPRFPTAILSTGIMILAFVSLTCGLILDSVSRGRREAKLLAYLARPSLRETLET